MPEKMSIKQLEEILQHDDEIAIEILPNGEIRAKDSTSEDETKPFKPLTYRENLGGEYGVRVESRTTALNGSR